MNTQCKSCGSVKFEYKEGKKVCAYCGKKIEDTNDTGSLCYRCYMKEYYPEEQDL